MKIRQFFGHWLFAAILILGVQSGKIHKKVRRSALSLPEGSSVSIIMDIIVPVVPLLNTTLTYLWFDFPVTYDVPTAATLNDLYASLGFIDNTSTNETSKKDSQSFSDLHHEFIEDQRANVDRKQVYQYVEGFFQKYYCKHNIISTFANLLYFTVLDLMDKHVWSELFVNLRNLRWVVMDFSGKYLKLYFCK